LYVESIELLLTVHACNTAVNVACVVVASRFVSFGVVHGYSTD